MPFPNFNLDRLADAVATDATVVAAGTASDTVIKDAPGRLCTVIVTASDTNPLLIYDNASAGSGTVIGAVPASAAVGSSYTFNAPAENGITVDGHADNPGVTITWS